MINVQDMIAARAEAEQKAAEKERQDEPASKYARAPAGNGHEVALKQRSGQR